MSDTPKPGKIKAIITDCYGVLTQDSWLKIINQYFSHDPEGAEQARHANHLYDKGQMSEQDFLEEIAKLSSQSPEKVRQELFSGNIQNTELLEYYKSFKLAGYKLAVLSNAASLKEVLDVVGAYESIFDCFIISAEVGYIKPEPQIYQITLERLGLGPDEVIFIDDRSDFVIAAQQKGINSILYRSNQDTKHKLNSIINVL
jgi:putative hydrolase of the HAD superfamily